MCFLSCGSLPFASHAHTNSLDLAPKQASPIEQAGFRRGGGTIDHIANSRWMMERAREHQQYICFIVFKKVFGCVDRSRGNVDYLRDGGGVPTHQE